jgi:glycosyltransferase involved in cell wall biosynthesis
MNVPLVVLIAACKQPALLHRTLATLAACEKPACYRGVIVVENGPKTGLEQVVAEFPRELHFEYRYSEPANKSLALNRALATVAGSLVVFTDDDVRVPAETLLAYARGAAGVHCGEFYGGPIFPDYEGERPAKWLLPMLPRSAAGWKWDVPAKTEIAQPEFIGPNFAAFASDVLRLGGYDTRLGPGKQLASPGEDTEIQERLLASGARGYYLPDAGMHHWVRAGACGLEFAVERAERNGVYWGLSQARRGGFYPRRWLKMTGQWINDRWRIGRWEKTGSEIEQARAKCLAARWRGRWQGIRLAAEWERAASLARKAA